MSISEAYDRLVSLLDSCPHSIEIIPGDGQQFLFVDGNLGAPQKILYKVYLYAVPLFNTARRTQHHSVLAASSAVLLLVNPSHQTALNARKRLVQSHHIDPHTELRLLTALLASPHAAKHAELWYHRRWLAAHAHSDPGDAHDVLAQAQERALVARACEVYPRNYFAWTHRLIAIQALFSYTSLANATLDVLRHELVHIKAWIDRHVSDYSAMHTLLAIAQMAFESGDASLRQIVDEADVLGHAIALVQAYPTHEALWVYVRTALVMPATREEQRTQPFMDHVVRPLARLQHPTISREDDLVQASRYARQFMDRGAGASSQT